MNGLGGNLDIVFPPLFSKDEIRCVIPNKKIVAFEPFFFSSRQAISTSSSLDIFTAINNDLDHTYYLTNVVACTNVLNASDKKATDFDIVMYNNNVFIRITPQYEATYKFGSTDDFTLRTEIKNIFCNRFSWRYGHGTGGSSSIFAQGYLLTLEDIK